MRWPGQVPPVTTDTTSTTPLPGALDDLLNGVEPRGARHARPQSSWRWAGPVVLAALVLALSLAGWRLVFHVTAPDPNRLGPLPPAVVEPSGVEPSLPELDSPVPPRADRARPRRTTMPTRTPSPTPARTTPRPSPASTVTVTKTTRPPSSPPPLPSPTPSAEVPQP